MLRSRKERREVSPLAESTEQRRLAMIKDFPQGSP
jgi:hypothetical protein